MNKQEIRLKHIKWWHQVPLRDGTVTPGQIPIHTMESEYLFDKIDFEGKSVLDIGCWDGYFCFRAEQLGASRVVGLDNPRFRWGGLAGFEFLKEHFESSVEFREGTIFDLPLEEFDVVLCYGVLYHVSDPLAAMINCFHAARETVVFEGLMTIGDEPVLKLLSGFDGDHSNVYSMSKGFAKHVAKANGFDPIAETQAHPHRGAVLFEADDFRVPAYPHYCFPVPPNAYRRH